jgi:glutaminyl-peptide cyclotransferase
MTRRVQLEWVLLLVVGLCACGKPATYRYDGDAAVSHKFSGDLAMGHVTKLVGFGPRPAGSSALETSRKYIEARLSSLGWETQRQTFESETPASDKVTFVNLRARYTPKPVADLWERPYKVLIGSHYDTKLYEDIEFLGANDSGSSTGALIEIARVLVEQPSVAQVCELVFFDGEEAFGKNITDVDGLYGSRYFAKQLRKEEASQHPEHGIILDMIGDRNLNVGVPVDSPRGLYKKLLKAANDLGYGEYFGMHNSGIIDDHVPLNEIGIPTIDIIDLDFQPWHTAGDTLDQVSSDSLRIVGSTTLLLIEKYLLGDD